MPFTNPIVINPTEWENLVDNATPTKKQIVDNIQVDTSNLAKLNEANTFTESNTFEGEVTFANTPTITNPTEWASMGDNDIPTKKQIQDNIQGGGGIGSAGVTLDTEQTITGLKTFTTLPQSSATPADPKDLVPKQYNDDRLTGVENNINTKIGNLTQLTTNAKDNLVNAINEVNNTTPKLLKANITWTVGTGGDYTTLLEAFNEAIKYSRNFNITLMLKSGFIWNKSISISNKDLSGIYITSEDSEVTADGSILSSVRNSSFLTLDNCIGLSLDILLNCINMNDASTKHGIFVQNRSNLQVGTNAGCKGANNNISVSYASCAHLQNAIFDNALMYGILCQSSLVNARNCSIKNCNVGVGVYSGGIVNTAFANFTGTASKTSIAPNTLSPYGIIFNSTGV